MKIQIDKEKLKELISLNWKRQEIANFFNVSSKTISERVKEYGLTFKKIAKEKEEFICKTCGKSYHQSKYHPYCCKKCAGQIDTSVSSEAHTELGRNIIELRRQGKTYKEIIEQLGCTKATISYYCNSNGKQYKKDYVNNKYNPAIKKLCKTVSTFQSKIKKDKIRSKCEDYVASFKSKVSNFVGNWERKNKMKSDKRFTYKEVLDYIGGWTTTCYLTGRPIDLTTDEYELDHIIPISKGGSCELNNMGITCKQANRGKYDMSVEEYIQLCKDVLEHHGYKVEKL